MTRIYPGMLDKSKEYFKSGSDVLLITDGTVRKFDDVAEHPELAMIISNDADLRAILQEWHGNDEREQQKTLAKCRFGALNFFADINDDEITHDYIECPMRGSCAGENIVCKPPVINGEPCNHEEIAILKELSGDETNIAIAKKLGLPLGTLNVKKTNLYQKLGLYTKQHAVLTLLFEGLL
jgi:DNA-binding CsgD family transcriptional regulator